MKQEHKLAQTRGKQGCATHVVDGREAPAGDQDAAAIQEPERFKNAEPRNELDYGSTECLKSRNKK